MTHTWSPIEVVQHSDPLIIGCENEQGECKLFQHTKDNEYVRIGGKTKLYIDNIDMYIEDGQVYDREYEVNQEFEPVRNRIDPDDFEEYVEPVEFCNIHEYMDLDKSETITCPICQDDITGGIVGVTPCQHMFHNKCIKKWLTKKCTHPVCPSCNTDVRIIDENN